MHSASDQLVEALLLLAFLQALFENLLELQKHEFEKSLRKHLIAQGNGTGTGQHFMLAAVVGELEKNKQT